MKSSKVVVCYLALVFGFFAFFSKPVLAQTSTTGALTVAVKDPSGAVVPGAAATVTNGAGLTRSEKTGADGSFTFTLLPPGNYQVTISASGFKTVAIPSAEVDVSETHVLNSNT